MTKEPKEMPEFLNKLNEVAAVERRSLFGYHVPKGNILKHAYAYCYVATKKEALELAAWLLKKSIDSEILYVESKKKYLVKIAFLHTYYSPEHFDQKSLPGEIIRMQTALAEVIKKVDPEWAPTCTLLSRTLVSLFHCGHQHRQLKIEDICQTTLFMTGVDKSNDPMATLLVPEVTIPEHFWNYVGQQVDRFISDIELAHQSWQTVKGIIISQAEGKSPAQLQSALKSFSDSNRKDIAEFCQICTTDLFTFSKALKLDNLFYQLRLLIAKQMETVENKPEYPAFIEKWTKFKNHCIVGYKESADLLKRVPNRLYPEVCLSYYINFLLFDALSNTEKVEPLNHKRIGLERAQTNSENIQRLTDKYTDLKGAVIKLSTEMFEVMNPETSRAPQVDSHALNKKFL